jgi:subtilisin family serine protease
MAANEGEQRPDDDLTGDGSTGGAAGGGGAGQGGDDGLFSWRPSDRPWAERVAFSEQEGGFAYRPGELLVVDSGAARAALERYGVSDEHRDEVVVGSYARYTRLRDPLRLSRRLGRLGVRAQPNHVFFITDDACCCRPHPSLVCAPGAGASPVYASPVYASPVYASPVYASPVYASPVYASAADALRYRLTGQRKSSARPSTAADAAACGLHFVDPPVQSGPRVAVLDTGIAMGADQPSVLSGASVTGTPDVPDHEPDQILDPAAGHGTFITGLICQIAPGCELLLPRVVEPEGDVGEWSLAQTLGALVGRGVAIVNLSISGYTLTYPDALAEAIDDIQQDGAVVVASAGNDASCRPTFPAAFPGVIGVGAIGPTGPASFTNYGPWVRACAPGVDLTSSFFQAFNGAETAAAGELDPDDFTGFATWSGTSFSAPVVAATVALAMQREPGLSAEAAVARVIDAPGLMRLTDLGTVVNGL